MRIDKYLWCVRLYKTRSLATKAVKEGKVFVNSKEAKPSKDLELGQKVSIKIAPTFRIFEILDFPKSRVGSKLTSEYIREITPKEDLELLERIQKEKQANASFGIKGRPTKRDRRELSKIVFLSQSPEE